MSPRTILELLGLIVAAFVAATVGGLLVAIPAPWWIDVPLIGLAGVCYTVALGLVGLFAAGVRHVWNTSKHSQTNC